MQLILKKMFIENFKGIKNLEISFDERKTDIHGANGTGKSSIVDAFCWALFDKDAHGNAPGSNFKVKPLDDDGAEVHNLTTTVELFCELDGARFDLKREQSENWVKRRGSTSPEFKGNVSAYYWNDAPVKQNEYKAKISEIADDDLFRLLGTLSAFNGMEWKKRRAQLIALSDIDVDAELLKMDKFAPLVDEMQARNLDFDKLKAALDSDRKKENKELAALPIRIDEAKKSLPTFTTREVAEDAEYIVKETQKDIQHVDKMIAEARAKSPEAKRQELEKALEREKKAAADTANAKIRGLSAEASGTKKLLEMWEREAERCKARIADLELKKNTASTLRDDLRRQYAENFARTLDLSEAAICPCCGQIIPEEKRIETFNADKKKKADEITAQGKKAAEALSRYEKYETTERENLAKTNEEWVEATKKLDAQEAELEAVRASSIPKTAEQERLEKELAAFDGGDDEAREKELAQLTERRRELEATLARNQAVIARKNAAMDTEKRIAQLEQQQRETADRLGKLEALQILADEFTAERCDRLTDTINAKFPTVRWKLFDALTNGAIVDTCVCMIPCDGALVDYLSANTAAQINADIEVVNALSAHYGVSVPLFVDNAERVNDLTQAAGQMVTLSVSGDNQLTFKRG